MNVLRESMKALLERRKKQIEFWDAVEVFKGGEWTAYLLVSNGIRLKEAVRVTSLDPDRYRITRPIPGGGTMVVQLD